MRNILKLIKKIKIVIGLLYITGCAVSPQTNEFIQSGWGDLQSHSIKNVPFYPQEEYFCGPTTLAEVFNYYDHNYRPQDLAKLVVLPKKNGSLQIEMIALSRQENFIPYSGKASLSQVLKWVSQDIPVIVLQNLGLDSYPLWHYALVKGFNTQQKSITLHTGITANRVTSMKNFENSWRRGNYWVLVPLPKNVISKDMTPIQYIKAAIDLKETGHEQLAKHALKLASSTWKKNWLAPFLLGNNHLETNPEKAKQWYQIALERDPLQHQIWNNYAYALQKTNCFIASESAAKCAVKLKPEDKNAHNTLNEIRSFFKNLKVKTIQTCAYRSCSEF